MNLDSVYHISKANLPLKIDKEETIVLYLPYIQGQYLEFFQKDRVSGLLAEAD